MSAVPITDLLAEHLARVPPRGVVSVYVFGSQARATAHAESDVDVAVLFDRSALPAALERRRAAERLAADLIAITHCNRVDVVSLGDASPELGAAAVREGRRVYCAEPETDHAFVRTVLLRAADLRPFLTRTRRVKLEALAR